MKKIETLALILVLTILLMVIILVLSLTINSLMEVGSSAINYYQFSERHKAACLSLSDNVEWVDETFLGFGEDGSYGCFLRNRGE